ILLITENAQSFFRSLADFSGIRSKERRRTRNEISVHDGEMQRHVVTFHAPAPRILRGGYAEHRDVILQWITHHGPPSPSPSSCPAASCAESPVAGHDCGRGAVPALTERALHQIVHECALVLTHVFQ